MMKPDYAYFPANGVRQTNGHTEWLFKFYPLKDEIQNIKDRKAAALEFLRTGEGEVPETPPSTTGCGNIPLTLYKNMSGKGMEGLGKGGVCELPHQIANRVASYLGGGRKKTRRKSHKKAHKKKRKKTRRRSHKKKRKTRKKKIKRK
jgi:hypothetical protein